MVRRKIGAQNVQSVPFLPNYKHDDKHQKAEKKKEAKFAKALSLTSKKNS